MDVYILSDADATVGCILYSIPPCNKPRSIYKQAIKYIARIQLGKYALSWKFSLQQSGWFLGIRFKATGSRTHYNHFHDDFTKIVIKIVNH